MRVILSGTLALLLTSCMGFSEGEFGDVRRSIARQQPQIKLEKEFAVSVGGGMFNFIDMIDASDVDYSELDHVHVVVYNVVARAGQEIDFSSLDFSATLHELNPRLQWDVIVRVREPDTRVWVLAGLNYEKQSLEAISVFSWERDELVVINVDGDLNDMIDYALQPARRHRRGYES